jgi:hypothetical protein
VRLTPADFETTLDLDAELDLEHVTPALFQALERLEPFGQGNPEPVFSARAVRLMAPPKILKDKHVKLKLAASMAPVNLVPANQPESELSQDAEELTEVAVLTTPRCHPDGASIPRASVREATENRSSLLGNRQLRTENQELRSGVTEKDPAKPNWRRNITFDALGWGMAERLQNAKLLAGDTLDIAFTIGHNDHPEYGGLELSLRDFVAGKTNGTSS